MFCTAATSAGDPKVPNEDWFAVTPDMVIVLDGATIRTDTGCTHGAAWYTRQLGAALAARVPDAPSLTHALTDAIFRVAGLHPDCDLGHPGTPSAAVGIVRKAGNYLQCLVLGDVTIVLDIADGDESCISVLSDPRVSATAPEQRAEADRHPIGSPEKATALLSMKHGELAARNQPGGYWIAAADPYAAHKAIVGQRPIAEVSRMAALSDGAARLVDLFGQTDYGRALDYLNRSGPGAFLDRVRDIEHHDPKGVRYPRNKVSDDATAVYAQPANTPPPDRPLPPHDERFRSINQLLDRTQLLYGDGNPMARHDRR